ncbi:MAG: hypothetical protein HY819_18460 [Acidobacteria bacterium]|nr:hypothetical protein [Acidobacteriota bacterium]
MVNQVDHITPFNGVCIKISGAGCLLNITDDEATGTYKAVLGVLASSNSITVKKYDLQGILKETYSLQIDSENTFLSDTNEISFEINPAINPNLDSRLIPFSYMPNLSSLYTNSILSPIGRGLYIDWSKFSYRIEFHIKGRFSTYNLADCADGTRKLANMTFHNKSFSSTPTLDFGEVGKNIGCAINFSPDNKELFLITESEKTPTKTLISSYEDNLFTVVEIVNCLDDVMQPLSYYYGNEIIKYGIGTPIKADEGIHATIDNCGPVTSLTTKVYCSPVTLSANQP